MSSFTLSISDISPRMPMTVWSLMMIVEQNLLLGPHSWCSLCIHPNDIILITDYKQKNNHSINDHTKSPWHDFEFCDCDLNNTHPRGNTLRVQDSVVLYTADTATTYYLQNEIIIVQRVGNFFLLVTWIENTYDKQSNLLQRLTLVCRRPHQNC